MSANHCSEALEICGREVKKNIFERRIAYYMTRQHQGKEKGTMEGDRLCAVTAGGESHSASRGTIIYSVDQNLG